MTTRFTFFISSNTPSSFLLLNNKTGALGYCWINFCIYERIKDDLPQPVSDLSHKFYLLAHLPCNRLLLGKSYIPPRLRRRPYMPDS